MKIILYTTNTCEFSKKEKEFLAANNLPFEEKNLESNREFLTEMLAVSNNFAGTPVTKIEKDDGQIVILKGFTEEEFKTTLGLVSSPTAAPVTPNPVPDAVSAPEPAVPQPVTPPSVIETPVVPPPVAEVPQAPVQTSPADAQLNSILNDLQSAAQPATPTPTPATPPAPVAAAPTPSPAANLPNIPEPNFS